MLGGSTDRAGGSGLERGGEDRRLAPGPGGLELGQVGGGALGGQLGRLEGVAARLPGALVGFEGDGHGRLGRVEGRLRLDELAGAGRGIGEFADLFGQRQALRGAGRFGGQGRRGLATRRCGLVEGDLGELELEQLGREVVAAVVHQGVEGHERLGPAREVDLGAQRLHFGSLRRECVGVGLRRGELVEPAGDCLSFA